MGEEEREGGEKEMVEESTFLATGQDASKVSHKTMPYLHSLP